MCAYPYLYTNNRISSVRSSMRLNKATAVLFISVHGRCCRPKISRSTIGSNFLINEKERIGMTRFEYTSFNQIYIILSIFTRIDIKVNIHFVYSLDGAAFQFNLLRLLRQGYVQIEKRLGCYVQAPRVSCVNFPPYVTMS